MAPAIWMSTMARRSPMLKLQQCASRYSYARRFSTSVDSDDYQFLQRSKVPMLHFQPSLPRLPIPDLNKTCQRYLNSQKPLLSPDQFKETQNHVIKFQQGIGRDLQKRLQDWDARNKHTSYISAPWFDMYLRDRQPLPLNYNPYMVFTPDPKPGYNSQLTRASNFLVSSLRFMRSLRSRMLEPEVFHLNPAKSDTPTFRTVTRLLPSSISWYGAYMFNAYPLDMSQYPGLFNANRIPEVGKDRLFQDTSARHIVVSRNGHLYTFDVLDSSGNILPPRTLHACLSKILLDDAPPAAHPIGAMTSQERDTWARTRTHLATLGNADNLRAIDSSILHLCLDGSAGDDDEILVLRTFLHGDPANRWFDKSFSLIVSSDGFAGANFEHSWGDGVAMLRLINDVSSDTLDHPLLHPDTPVSSKDDVPIKRLDFVLDQRAKDDIDEARRRFQKVSDSLQLDVLQIHEYGRDFCRKHKISPDAYMQMGYQIAYHRLCGKTTATYESCSTAAFRHGRTETIRPATMATKELSEALNRQSRPSPSELRSMILNCSKLHGKLTKEAAMGQGFDRHLFGLRKEAEKGGIEIPGLYKDPAYAAINYNILSTSTLNSPHVHGGGFGPVVPDGLGIAYVIRDDSLGVAVTSYPAHNNGHQFVDSLGQVFKDLHSVMELSYKP